MFISLKCIRVYRVLAKENGLVLQQINPRREKVGISTRVKQFPLVTVSSFNADCVRLYYTTL